MHNDIAYRIAYLNPNIEVTNGMDFRAACVNAGLDMQALDRRYRMACSIVASMADEVPKNVLVARVIEACAAVDEAHDDFLGEFEIQPGNSVMLRASIAAKLCVAPRGTWAIKRVQKDEFLSYEACMSMGNGKIFSGEGGVREVFNTPPDYRKVFHKMLVHEAFQISREINRELERQFNKQLVDEKNINPGVTIRGVFLPNHPGVTSVVVESVHDDGMVAVQCVRPGSKHRVRCVFPASALVGVPA